MTPEEAWRALEEDLADYLERKGVVPSCRAGCFACCFGLVTLSRLEGLALLPHLTPLQKARLLEEGPRRLALLKEGKDDPHFPSRFFQSRTPCPLLEEGLCGVYPQRPLACRGLLIPFYANAFVLGHQWNRVCRLRVSGSWARTRHRSATTSIISSRS
jgi:hypothetical protein